MEQKAFSTNESTTTLLFCGRGKSDTNQQTIENTPTKTCLTWGKGDKALEQEWSTMQQDFKRPWEKGKKKQLKTHNEHEGGEPFCWP